MNQQPRILIVDDEADLREILVEQLENFELPGPKAKGKCVIETAVNGADALKKVEAGWFDAILSDINMPIMNGLEFLAQLRATGRDIPLIFLTAFGDKAKAVEALRLGAMDFLDKPWKADDLRMTLASAIELGYNLRELENELEVMLRQYTDISDERRRQLRAVHRSLLLMKFNTLDRGAALIKKAG